MARRVSSSDPVGHKSRRHAAALVGDAVRRQGVVAIDGAPASLRPVVGVQPSARRQTVGHPGIFNGEASRQRGVSDPSAAGREASGMMDCMYASDATYGDWLRLGFKDWNRRMALVFDPPFESDSFSLWVFGVFDAYSFFYLSLQFAVEGYERRSTVAFRRNADEESKMRFGASHVGGGAADPVTGSAGHDGWVLGADLASNIPEERWDDITYGLKMPAFYSHAARALLRDVVQLFERYLYCRMRESNGEAIPREADRTPAWFACVRL